MRSEVDSDENVANEPNAADGTTKDAPQEGRARRDRKQAPIFKPEPVSGERKAPKMLPGDGPRLRDLEYVKYKFDGHRVDDELMKLLHRTIFGTEGKHTIRKRDLLDFAGFKGEDKKATDHFVSRAERHIATYHVTGLNLALDVFGLPRGAGAEGTKEAKAARLLDFLKAPVQPSKSVPTAAQKAKAASPAKRARAAAAEPRAKRPKGAKKAAIKADECDKEAEEAAREPLTEGALQALVVSVLDGLGDVSQLSVKGLKELLVAEHGVAEAAVKEHRGLIKNVAVEYMRKAVPTRGGVSSGGAAVAAAAPADEESRGEEAEEGAVARGGTAVDGTTGDGAVAAASDVAASAQDAAPPSADEEAGVGMGQESGSSGAVGASAIDADAKPADADAVKELLAM